MVTECREMEHIIGKRRTDGDFPPVELVPGVFRITPEGVGSNEDTDVETTPMERRKAGEMAGGRALKGTRLVVVCSGGESC